VRKNFTQAGERGINERTYIEGDWYNRGIPPNVIISDKAYIDTSFGFAAFYSLDPCGFFIDEASGCYDRSSFIASETGRITIGKFSIINGATLICKQNIAIGNHCMLAWGSVVTDCWPNTLPDNLEERKALLYNAAHDSERRYPFSAHSKPVIIEDNVWVGFDAVILPGITLGRGCIIGCKTIITENIPPYAIVTGSPATIKRYMESDDTDEARDKALSKYIRKGGD
jgi:acetyltransferase-like isoleucine patch superfamily enzyme